MDMDNLKFSILARFDEEPSVPSGIIDKGINYFAQKYEHNTCYVSNKNSPFGTNA